MNINNILQNKLLSELKYTASKSSGSGGQNVNKVNTKVELRFNILQSDVLSESQKAKLLDKLKNRINSKQELIIVSEKERSQLKNKQLVTERFLLLLRMALTKQKIRKPTKPLQSSNEKRLRIKKVQSEKKNLRRSIDF